METQDGDAPPRAYTAFAGEMLLSRGPAETVALAAKAARDADPQAAILIFDDRTGRSEDFDLSGTPEQIAGRLRAIPAIHARQRLGLANPPASASGKGGRGRPKLGVVGREVTLLPRHWDWLAEQPGGASAALRRLVEEARKTRRGEDAARRRREAAYGFMSAMAGDRPGFEEAARSLFAGDMDGLSARIAGWPADVRDHVMTLAVGEPRPA